ncbi:hypothetical protein BgiBS90_020438 [Biomphalaria glabrata]|nr:hypothetical protein BgiBS90_020438 [Biomphalaria glabrata]
MANNQLLAETLQWNELFGEHECAESEDEKDMLKKYLECTKNPRHTSFVPILRFSLHHLPDAHRDPDLFELIKVIADLTVRINVSMVSSHRPEFFPITKAPYPYYNMGGDSTLRSGTGEIYVVKYVDGCGQDKSGSSYDELNRKYEKTYKFCPCTNCKGSKDAKNVWWEIFVYTAAHVVFDESEAEHTRIRLFFDERNCPKVILDNVSVGFTNVQRDICVLKYETCDVSLGDKLYKKVVLCNDLWSKVDTIYEKKPTSRFNFIVSHPHGLNKQVSFGQWTENRKHSVYNEKWDFTKLTYTTSTCPGSSGASVYCLGLSTGHVHNGALSSGLNYSSIDLYKK